MNPTHLLPKRFHQDNFFYGWYIAMAGTFNNFFVIGITVTGLGLFYEPMHNELGWSMSSILLGASIRSFNNGMMAPITGFMVDRLGPRRMAMTGLTVLSIGLVMISQSHTLPWYYFSSLVAAMGQSLGVFSPFSTSIMYWFQKKRARAMGIINSGNAFGYYIVPALAFGVTYVGWRATLALAGAAIFSVGVPIAYFVLRDRPEKYGLLPDGEDPEVARLAAAQAKSDGKPAIPERAIGMTVGQAMRTPAFYLIVLAQAAGGGTQNLWNLLQYPHLQHAGYTLAQASLILSTYGGVQGILRIVAGVVADRVGRRSTLIVGYLLQGIGYTVFAFMSPDRLYLIPALFLTYGIGHATWNVTTNSVSADYFGTRRVASLSGLTTSLVTPIGVLAPYLAGVAFDHFQNYFLVYIVCGITVSTGALWQLLIRRPQWTVIRSQILAEEAAKHEAGLLATAAAVAAPVER